MNPVTAVDPAILAALKALADRGIDVAITPSAANGHHRDVVLTQAPEAWTAQVRGDGMFSLVWRQAPTLEGAIVATLTDAGKCTAFSVALRTIIRRHTKAIRAAVKRAAKEAT